MTDCTRIDNLHALYLEDEVLVALDGEMILRDMGFASVTILHDLKAAKDHLDTHTVDFALLDVNLGDGTNSLALAADLVGNGVHVAFVSGYNKSEGIMPDTIPLAGKPFSKTTIRAIVSEAISRSA